MKIADNSFVSIDYRLSLESGEEVDRSPAGSPLGFVAGTGSIIPGLESALMGREAGEGLRVTVEPEQAYGPVQQELLQIYPARSFSRGDRDRARDVVPGARAARSGRDDRRRGGRGRRSRSIMNHPMAGKRLIFDVNVVEVREPLRRRDAPVLRRVRLRSRRSRATCGCGPGGGPAAAVRRRAAAAAAAEDRDHARRGIDRGRKRIGPAPGALRGRGRCVSERRLLVTTPAFRRRGRPSRQALRGPCAARLDTEQLDLEEQAPPALDLRRRPAVAVGDPRGADKRALPPTCIFCSASVQQGITPSSGNPPACRGRRSCRRRSRRAGCRGSGP